MAAWGIGAVVGVHRIWSEPQQLGDPLDDHIVNESGSQAGVPSPRLHGAPVDDDARCPSLSGWSRLAKWHGHATVVRSSSRWHLLDSQLDVAQLVVPPALHPLDRVQHQVI